MSGVDLGALPGGNGTSIAYGVNTAGGVVGLAGSAAGANHAFWSAYAQNAITTGGIDLGSQAGSSSDSAAWALDPINQITGTTMTPSATHRPFLKNQPTSSWSSTYALTAAMPSPLSAGDFAVATAMNDKSQMVGYANYTPGGTDHRAFIWTPGSTVFTVKNLNDFLNSAQQSAWTLEEAYGINDAGWIVGWGYYYTYPTAFLLQPN